MFYSGSFTVSESIERLQWTLQMQQLNDLSNLIPSDPYKILWVSTYISDAGGSLDVTYSTVQIKRVGKKGELSKYRK